MGNIEQFWNSGAKRETQWFFRERFPAHAVAAVNRIVSSHKTSWALIYDALETAVVIFSKYQYAYFKFLTFEYLF